MMWSGTSPCPLTPGSAMTYFRGAPGGNIPAAVIWPSGVVGYCSPELPTLIGMATSALLQQEKIRLCGWENGWADGQTGVNMSEKLVFVHLTLNHGLVLRLSKENMHSEST